MKTGTCRCGNRIYFNNYHCLACDARLGRCCACGALASFTETDARVVCDACGRFVHACKNQQYAVCHSFNAEPNQLCQWCQFTDVIPPLHQPESVGRWAIMESAKRRLLLQLEDLHLPPFVGDVGQTHRLSFEFKEDQVEQRGEPPEEVTTGHQNGLITINLAEADSVHREQLRIRLNEPQRTLIGHMRHEVGHYLDWAWASRVAPEEYNRLFGDPAAVDYAAAMERHYAEGAPRDWADNYVSAYATMHPWEDFAETVNVYLDIMAIATTANEIGGHALDLSSTADAAKLVHAVLKVVIEVSEYNFDLGLSPLLPERLPPSVIAKLSYVHTLRNQDLRAGAFASPADEMVTQ